MNKWNNTVMWPRDNFVNRVIEESFSPSKSSGNPMITLTFEVVSPETFSVAGETYTGVGQKTTRYFTTGNIEDAEKDAKAKKGTQELFKKFGLPHDNINWDNPKLGFKGKLVHTLMGDNLVEERKSPTAEQLKKGIKQGDVIMNPVTKKPRTKHYPQILEIDGLASADTNKPY
jgi:hypothetical protein